MSLDFLGPEEVSGLAASPQPAVEFVVGPDLIPLKSRAVELESAGGGCRVNHD